MRMDWVRRFYDMLSLQQVTMATPTLANARKPYHQLSSCFIDTVPDSLEGIYRSLDSFAKVSKWGGGMGLYFGKVRATGAAIRGFEGAAGFGMAHFRHPRQHGAGSRIGNGQRGTVVCRAPLATDQATVGQQAGIIEFQHGFILGGRWPLPAWRQTGWPALHRKPGLRW